jgi:hypothetical protein
MMMPRQSVYKQIEYQMNIDCFAVGVMTGELATHIHAFTNPEEDSNSPVTDLKISYYHRKMSVLSQLRVELSEGDPNRNIMKYVTKFLNIPLESKPNKLSSLTYSLALPLRDEKNRLSAEGILEEFSPETNEGRRELWLNMLTVSGLTSLNERNFGRSAGESSRQDGVSDPTGPTG